MTDQEIDNFSNRLVDRLLNPPVAPLRQRIFATAFNSIMPFALGILFASVVFAVCFIDFAQVISAAIEKSCVVK